MANQKIGIVFAVDGEKELKSALQAAKKETSLYQTALKNLSKESADSKNSLKYLQEQQEKLSSAQRAWTDRVKAAQDGLKSATDAYNNNRESLEKLKAQYDEAKTKLKEMEAAGDTTSESYRQQKELVDKLATAVSEQAVAVNESKGKVNDWNKELNTAESGLRQCNTEIDKNEQYLREAKNATDGCATSIDKYGNEVKEAKDDQVEFNESLGSIVKNRIADMAVDALRGLADKAKEAAKYVVDVGSSFEAQMSKVSAISGATGADFEALKAKAMEMGQTTVFSASEAGEAMEYMAMAGWKTEDMLNGISGIMDLAASSGENLGTASDIVTDALTAFGQSAGEAGRLADIMAAASSNANTNVSMMGETFKYCAPVAGALGYTMEDTSIAIGLMANSGIKASQAGTAIRAGLTNLVKPAKQAAEAMDKYKISVTDDQGNMRTFRDLIAHLKDRLGGLSEEEQAAAAAAIFGKNAMSGWLAIINAAPADVDKLTNAIDNSAGTAKNMADVMVDNLPGAIKLFNSATESLGITLYNYFSGPLTKAVQIATDLINGITAIISPHRTELESFIDDIDRSNTAIEQSLSHARSTIENANLEVGELEASKQAIKQVLDSCEQFNKIDLGEGRYQIVDATGRVVREGFEPLAESATTTDDIIAKFGSNGIKTEKVHEGTKAVATYFDDAGNVIGRYKTTLDDAGNATFKADGVAEGSKVVIQAFDDAGDRIVKFKTTMDDTGEIKFHTDGITSGIDTATEYIGHVETKVHGVEERLKNFASDGINTEEINRGVSAIIEIFDEAGEPVNTLQRNIEDTGKVALDTAEVEGGTSAIITAFDEASGSVKSFKVDLTDSVQEFDVSGLSSSLSEVETSISNVYKVTDAWEKRKIDALVTNLGGAVKELAAAWNSETGELSATNEQMEEWFDKAKQIAMYTALQDAINEMYSSWGDAAVNVTKATSAFNQALEEFNKEAGTTIDNADDFFAFINDSETGWYNSATAVNDAYDALQKANGVLSDAETELNNNVDALSGLKDIIGETGEETANTGKTAEEATTAIDNLGEAGDDAAEGAKGLAGAEGELAEKMAETKTAFEEVFESLGAFEAKQAELGESEALIEWAEGQIEALGDLADAYNKMVERIQSGMDAYVDALDTSGEEGTRALDNMIDNMNQRNQELEEWVANMKILGERAGRDLPQGLYDELVTSGPDKTREAVQQLVDAAQNQTGEFEAVAQSYERSLKLQTEAATLASYTSAGKEYASALSAGYVDETVADTSLVQNASSNLMGAANEAATQKATEAEGAGQEAVDSLSEGIDKNQKVAEASAEAVVEIAADAASKATAKFAEGGARSVVTYAGNIDLNRNKAKKAAENLANEAAIAAKNKATAFEPAGGEAATKYAQGIINNQSKGKNAAENAVMSSVRVAADKAREAESAGRQMVTSMANGVNNNRDGLAVAAKNAIINARNESIGATEYFREPGRQIPVRIADGIRENGTYIVGVTNRVLNDARNEALTTAGYYYSIGDRIAASIGNGVGGGTWQVSNAAVAVAGNAMTEVNNYVNRWDTFEIVGGNIDAGLARGIYGRENEVYNAARTVAYNALDSAQSALGIHSPSTAFEEGVGKQADLGMALGFERNSKVVEDAAANMAQKALSAADREMKKAPKTQAGLFTSNGFSIDTNQNIRQTVTLDTPSYTGTGSNTTTSSDGTVKALKSHEVAVAANTRAVKDWTKTVKQVLEDFAQNDLGKVAASPGDFRMSEIVTKIEDSEKSMDRLGQVQENGNRIMVGMAQQMTEIASLLSDLSNRTTKLEATINVGNKDFQKAFDSATIKVLNNYGKNKKAVRGA